MKAKDLTREVEEFQAALVAHRDLYGDSLNSTIPRYPIRNEQELEEQSRRLGRNAGRLRPYLDRFRPQWLMRFGIGPVVDALDAATGTAHIAMVKGQALQHVIDALNRVIGELQSFNPDDEIPDEPPLSVTSETASGAQRLIPATGRVLLIHGHDDANLSRIARHDSGA